MKKLLTLLFLGMFLISFTLALIFIDNSQTDFNNGVYFQTEYNTSFVQLSTNETLRETQNIVDMSGNILLMHLDESSGTIVDSSGHGNDGNYNGALYSQVGKIKTAIGFDGAESINCGNAANESYNSMTISAWFNASSFSPNRWRTVLHRNDGTSVGSSVFFIGFVSGSNQIIATIGSGSMGNAYMAGATGVIAQTNTWYHVVNSWNGTTAVIYVNGVEKGSYLMSSAIFNNKVATTRIGSSGDGTGYLFNGNIDETVIWNRSLSASEVEDIYNKQNGNYRDCYNRGNYTSQVFGNSSIEVWNNISWISNSMGELPSELNMSGNIILIHFNKTTGNNFINLVGTNLVSTAGDLIEDNFSTVGKFNNSLLVYNGTKEFEGSISGGVNWKNTSTVMFWHKPLYSSQNPSASNFNFGSTHPWNNNRLRITPADSWGGGVQTTLEDSGNIVYSCDWDYNDLWTVGEWYHFAFTFDVVNTGATDNMMEFYLDGEKIVQTTTCLKSVFTANGNQWLPENRPVWITDFATSSLAGGYDEFSAFNRTLSQEEIIENYKLGALNLNLSIRNCSVSDCSDGTWQDIDDESSQNLNLVSQYFQYKFDFETDDTDYSPFLYNVTIDYSVIPTLFVEITCPLNKTYGTSPTTLDYTIEHTKSLDTCWYSLDTGLTNTTLLSCTTNATGLTAIEGLNNWTVYVNDSEGNENQTIVFFTLDSRLSACTPFDRAMNTIVLIAGALAILGVAFMILNKFGQLDSLTVQQMLVIGFIIVVGISFLVEIANKIAGRCG